MTTQHPEAEHTLLCLEGLSLGDAFGESFFGSDANERIEHRSLSARVWRWTDDTAMAVSIVETLNRHGRIHQDDLARRFADRYMDEPARGYGSAMHETLSEIRCGADWRGVAPSQFGGSGSFGNGAAMRAPVVGAWFADDLERVVVEARRSAEITHAHPEGIAGAVAVATAAALALSGEDCPTGKAFIEAVLEHIPKSELRDRTARALQLDYQTPISEAARLLGNGSEVSAQDTVPLVVWCASQHLNDYEQALWLTVSALGDRDTTCAMVGGIVACRVGLDGIPAEWLNRREPLPAPPDVRGRSGWRSFLSRVT